MLPGFLIAVAVLWAGNYSSDSTPSLRMSTCCRFGPKKAKKKKKKKKLLLNLIKPLLCVRYCFGNTIVICIS